MAVGSGAVFLLCPVCFYCWVGPVWRCDHLLGEEGADCFGFRWFPS